MVKNLHANAGNARDVGSIPPLEKEMATHFSILPWKIPWTEEVWWTAVHGVAKSGTGLRTHAQLIDKISGHVLLIWTYSFRHVCVGVCPCSMVSDSSRSYGLKPTRLLCPWDFPGKNTGVGCHFLPQGIFPTQG